MTISIGRDDCNAMTGSRNYFFARLSSRGGRNTSSSADHPGRAANIIRIIRKRFVLLPLLAHDCLNANTRIAIWRAS